MTDSASWTNASQPPDTSRTVRLLLCDGETAMGFCWVDKRQWFLIDDEPWWHPCEPAGWREVEPRKETDDEQPCEYCGGCGSIKVDFEHPQWVRCEACAGGNQ